jgi:nitrite reductase (cytochrome c-552)
MSAEPHDRSLEKQPPAWRGWMLLVITAALTFALGIFAASIVERREEARQRPPLVPISPTETDSAAWGANYPREYETYLAMRGNPRQTKYGGSKQRDYLEQTPANVVLFAGYGFAKQYWQARGHVYAIEDVTSTPRIGPTSPATCFTCKSPDVPRLMAEMGPEKFYAQKFSAIKQQITHPIGCYDCHEPNTMKLRITRPALREAFKQQGRDIDSVSHQEMRSLVCAQCHVEYYFKGADNYLVFPWKKGITADDVAAYYEDPEFSDWTHAVSKARMVKIQHPDYELYRTGIHAYRNVACADCHMPYRTEGGVKFTSHHLQSPLFDIANSCAVCHRWGEKEIRDRVEAIQDKVHEGRGRAESALAQAHFDIAAAAEAGAGDEELVSVRKLVRDAQLRWDYVAASNGMGIHSPQEAMRQLEAAVDLAGQCRVACARILGKHGVTAAVAYPDFSTKEKAQAINKQFVDGKPPKLLPEGSGQ